MIIKLSSYVKDNRVYARVFVGQDLQHLEPSGGVVIDPRDYQMFRAALVRGADESEHHVSIIIEETEDPTTVDIPVNFVEALFVDGEED